MDAKELRKLSRSELLELLIEISEENDRIRADNDHLRATMSQRQIALSRAGNIAEAALQLNGVFAAAQAASEQYLENIERISGNAQELAEAILEGTRAQCDALRTKAKAETELWRTRTQLDCKAMTENAQREVDAKWAELREKIDRYIVEKSNSYKHGNLFGSDKNEGNRTAIHSDAKGRAAADAT